MAAMAQIAPHLPWRAPPLAVATAAAAARAPSWRRHRAHSAAAAPPPTLLSPHRRVTRIIVTASAGPQPASGNGAGSSSSSNGAAAVSLTSPASLVKLSSLGVVFVGSTIIYTLLQSLRDAIIVTACGGEALPFAAALSLPAAVAFFAYYDRLLRGPRRAVYYAAVLPLLAAYALFAFVAYPLAPSVQPLVALAPALAAAPPGLRPLLSLASHPIYAAYYLLSELWGSVAISVCFWTLADEACGADEAKALYPALGILANGGLVAAGALARFVNGAASGDAASLQLQTALMVVIGAAMCGAKAFIDVRLLEPARRARAAAAAAKESDDAAAAAAAASSGSSNSSSSSTVPQQQQPQPQQPEAKKKKKPKRDVGSSLQVLRDSPRVRALATLVIAYGVSHKLFEFAWKAQLRALHPTVSGYSQVLSDVAGVTGVATMLLLLGARAAFTRFGWAAAALATPVALLLTGAVFFASTIVPPSAAAAGGPAAALLAAGAAAGVCTQVAARAAKYAMFDPSRELVWISMKTSEREAGKAAVDLLGNQIGKSGGSWLTQGLLLLCGSMTAAAPATAALFLGVVAAWVRATLSLAQSMRDSGGVSGGGGDAGAVEAPPASSAAAAAAPSASAASIDAALQSQEFSPDAVHAVECEPDADADGRAASPGDAAAASSSRANGNGNGRALNGHEDGASSLTEEPTPPPGGGAALGAARR